MKYIIYTSTASIYFHPEMLAVMLAGFQKSNFRYDITGILVYNGGTFMQYIEGPDNQVNRLFKNIVKDKIHHSVIVWENRSSAARLFAEWSMSFKSVTLTQFRMMMGLTGGRIKEPATPTPLASYLLTLINPEGLHQSGQRLK